MKSVFHLGIGNIENNLKEEKKSPKPLKQQSLFLGNNFDRFVEAYLYPFLKLRI